LGKWTGAEASAMQQVVDQFNRSQEKIVVEYLAMSSVDRKTMVATAGGDPPDVAGLWLNNVYSYADRDALTPLDDFIQRDGQTSEQWLGRYVSVYADMCSYRGKDLGRNQHPVGDRAALEQTAILGSRSRPRPAAAHARGAGRIRRQAHESGMRRARSRKLGFLPQEPGWFCWGVPEMVWR